MSIGGQFRELGRFLDACEDDSWVVERVVVDDCPATDGDGDLAATVEVVHSAPRGNGDGRTLSLSSPRVDDDGTLRFALRDADPLVPSDDYDLDVEPTGATVDPDGTITTTLRASVPPTGAGPVRTARPRDERRTSWSDRRPIERSEPHGEDPANPGSSRDADGSTGSDRELPPFKDPELLRSVFESHDTFAEMAEAIDMDVTAETVRRYMIDFGIHQPKRYKTGGGTDKSVDDGAGSRDDEAARDDAESSSEEGNEDSDELGSEPGDGLGSEPGDGLGSKSGDESGDATTVGSSEPTPEEPVVLSDGIGLPEDVTVETLIDTVKRSNTLYEVTRAIDIDREQALQMLEELNLLDLVVGRLATEGERDLEREEIVERLRQASATA